MGHKDEEVLMRLLETARFKDAKVVRYRPSLAPVQVGDMVRVVIKGMRTIVGKVIEPVQVKGQDCWVVHTSKGKDRFNKSHCHRVQRARMSPEARRVQDTVVAVPEGDDGEVYGDGEI